MPDTPWLQLPLPLQAFELTMPANKPAEIKRLSPAFKPGHGAQVLP